MSCTRITFAVERGLIGEPDSVIQALTIAFFGATRDSASVTVLPGGVLTIDQGGMVDLGLKAAGDTASVIFNHWR